MPNLPRTLAVAAALVVLGCTPIRQLRDPATLLADGKAVRTRSEKALDYSIATLVAARPEVVWAVLTDGPAFTRWNSTLVKFEGQVVKDGQVLLVSKVAPTRTFTLKVSELEAPRHMVWEDGNAMFLGVRHFTLTPREGSTVVAMSETYSGLFLGSAEKEMPDFTANFETFAADLKREAERRAAAP